MKMQNLLKIFILGTVLFLINPRVVLAVLKEDEKCQLNINNPLGIYKPTDKITITGKFPGLRASWILYLASFSNLQARKQLLKCASLIQTVEHCTTSNAELAKGVTISAQDVLKWTNVKFGKFQAGIYQMGMPSGDYYLRCKVNFCIVDPKISGQPTCDPLTDESTDVGTCDSCNWCDKNRDGLRNDLDLKPSYWDTCDKCMSGETLKQGTKLNPGTWTALGCIPRDANKLIGWILTNAIMMGGGIAFLFMIFGAFQIIISGGDPEKINGGKEVLTSAIAGLLMIIFSVILLKIIGYDILRIPGINILG